KYCCPYLGRPLSRLQPNSGRHMRKQTTMTIDRLVAASMPFRGLAAATLFLAGVAHAAAGWDGFGRRGARAKARADGAAHTHARSAAQTEGCARGLLRLWADLRRDD